MLLPEIPFTTHLRDVGGALGWDDTSKVNVLLMYVESCAARGAVPSSSDFRDFLEAQAEEEMGEAMDGDDAEKDDG